MSYILGALGIAGSVMAMFPPVDRAVSYAANYALPNMMPDVMMALELYRRNKVLPEGFEYLMQNQGYNKETAHRIFEATNRLLNVQELVQLRRQGEIGQELYYTFMKMVGVSRHYADALMKTTLTMIPPADLVILNRRGFLLDADFDKHMDYVGVTKDRSDLLKKAMFRDLSPDDILSLLLRREIFRPEYDELMKSIGIDEENAERFRLARLAILDPTSLVVLKWRGEITPTEYHQSMMALGFTAPLADNFEQRMLFYPGPQDLVTWVAKEVFEPDAVAKYGLMDEWELLEGIGYEKAGITEPQMKNYWIAHWVHPEFMAIRDMYFRAKHADGTPKLTYDDIYEWFRLVEVPPYWRDKYIDIMHAPYTRVDVRRMYQAGVLDRPAVKTAYMELGYDEDKAEHMTQFTVAWSEPQAKTLTRTMIERAYKFGEISRDEALERLGIIGYDIENADLILSLLELQELLDERDDLIDAIVANFRNGVITQERAIEQLDMLALKATTREKIIAKSLTAKQRERKLPAKADVIDWYRLEMIDETQFRDYLDRLGHLPEDIDRYLQEIWLHILDELEKKSREVNPKLLPRTVLTRLFIEGKINVGRLRKGYTDLKFSDADIEILVASATSKREAREAKESLETETTEET